MYSLVKGQHYYRWQVLSNPHQKFYRNQWYSHQISPYHRLPPLWQLQQYQPQHRQNHQSQQKYSEYRENLPQIGLIEAQESLPVIPDRIFIDKNGQPEQSLNLYPKESNYGTAKKVVRCKQQECEHDCQRRGQIGECQQQCYVRKEIINPLYIWEEKKTTEATTDTDWENDTQMSHFVTDANEISTQKHETNDPSIDTFTYGGTTISREKYETEDFEINIDEQLDIVSHRNESSNESGNESQIKQQWHDKESKIEISTSHGALSDETFDEDSSGSGDYISYENNSGNYDYDADSSSGYDDNDDYYGL